MSRRYSCSHKRRIVGFFLFLVLIVTPPVFTLPEAPEDVYTRAADLIRPSVVSLQITSVSTERTRFEWLFDYWLSPELRRRMEHFWYVHVKKEKARSPRYVQRAGTGIVVDSDGLILTNEHLLSGVTDILVTLADRRQFKGAVAAADPWLDVALIRIPEAGLAVPVFADSKKVNVGQEVLSVGNALGFSHTVSRGIISGKERVVRDEQGRVFESVLQTDAAVNFGDSGGPLINMQGEVVALKLAIVPQGENISFALPANEFRKAIPELIESGKINRGWIGMHVVEKATGDEQVLSIQKLYLDSPASRMGLKPGDRIIEVNGRKPVSAEELYRWVRDQKIGSAVHLRVARENAYFEQSLPVVAFPSFSQETLREQQAGTGMGMDGSIPRPIRWFILLLSVAASYVLLSRLVQNAGILLAAPNRRYGTRRKGERRKGERRKGRTLGGDSSSGTERRKGIRRTSLRRIDSDRRASKSRRKR